MFNSKRLVVVVLLVAVLGAALPSWGASFKNKRISDQQFLDMCRDGDTQGVINAISSGANVNAKDNYGWTALMRAARDGYTEIVNALLKADANANAKDKYGWTALLLAAEKGHTEIVNALIEAGADDVSINGGTTALLLAAQNGHAETVNALIDAGAYVKAKNALGKMAVDYARDKLKGTNALKRLEELSK